MAPRSEERKMFTLKVFSIYLTEKKYILYICTSKLKKGLIYRYFTIEKNVDFEFFSIYLTIDKNVDAVGPKLYIDSIENTFVKDTFKIF